MWSTPRSSQSQEQQESSGADTNASAQGSSSSRVGVGVGVGSSGADSRSGCTCTNTWPAQCVSQQPHLLVDGARLLEHVRHLALAPPPRVVLVQARAARPLVAVKVLQWLELAALRGNTSEGVGVESLDKPESSSG